METKIAFRDELMLLNWAESSARGRTVTFQLNEEGEAHPFKDFTIRQGKRAGQRFMAVLVQIDDDEQPVEQRVTSSQQAAILCKSPDFWTWASARHVGGWIDSEASAREFMLSTLGISSRSEIDRNPEVADKFRRYIVVPFEAYRETLEPKL